MHCQRAHHPAVDFTGKIYVLGVRGESAGATDVVEVLLFSSSAGTVFVVIVCQRTTCVPLCLLRRFSDHNYITGHHSLT